jgi:chitodextrinase
VYSIPYPGSDLYTASARSAPVTFTTLAGPDTVAPSTPPAPIFGNITPTSVSIDWGDATDNVQVTGYYLEELIGGVWTVIRTVSAGNQFQGVAGLQPATAYSFAVVAFDARGNTSGRSAAGTVTTLATTAALTCTVAINQYPPGFTASVILLNTTTTTVNGWTIGFTLAPAATLTTTFNGVVTRSGSTGTITPASYDTVIPPSAQFTVGFLGTVSPFAPPTNFTFNGAPCPPA